MCSDDIRKWGNRLRKLIADMPDDIEVVVSYDHMDIHPTGTLEHHILVLDTGFGLEAEPMVSVATNRRIIPYSEGT